ncbi:MAG TPA: S26 family signal peptidase [Acidiphilium sp.]|nr:S26 family signal peptidase [Acidiphilium sp.]HQU25274.1 S26 family signal peptidase [Acidiphilium sp.]
MTRVGLAILSGLAMLGIGAPMIMPPVPELIWNASASVRIGLYAVRSAGTLHVSERVVVRPPTPLADFMARRRYLPLGVPLLKHIAALPGAKICRIGRTITVNGRVVGRALRTDWLHRKLPVWQGCHIVATRQVFLMNEDVKASFDGRYFGTLPTTTIVGQAYPIWTRGGR